MWRYDVEGLVIEKRVFLPHMQNTVHVIVRAAVRRGPRRLELALRPSVHFRAHEAPVSEPLGWPIRFRAVGDRFEICLAGQPAAAAAAQLLHGRAAFTFTLEARRIDNVLYPRRGEPRLRGARRSVEPRLLPARARARPAGDARRVDRAVGDDSRAAARRGARAPSASAARGCSRTRAGARGGRGAAELVLAADQFIITPGRPRRGRARARAAGDEVRTVIAGYHWFTDWGRDTMISLEGLTLVTGRHVEAGYILRTFAHYVRDGLIPNMFPEGENEGLYHTADATLCGSSTRSIATSTHTGDRADAARCCCRR